MDDFNNKLYKRINYNKLKKDEDENSNSDTFDENLNNLHRIEKIENLIEVINGNVNYINLELNSIKNSLKEKRSNFIKQKVIKEQKYSDNKIVDSTNENMISSETILKEIEKLKIGGDFDKLNNNLENKENEKIDEKRRNINFKNPDENRHSLLKIKSFNDLNLDLESLKTKKNGINDKINNNNPKNINLKFNENKEEKSVRDLNDIIEQFKKKQESENISINKKKFHKQVTLNERQDVFILFEN